MIQCPSGTNSFSVINQPRCGWLISASPLGQKTAPKATTADVPPPPKPKSEPVPFNQDEFKNDPLIQKALEVFKGRIVEVRA